MEDNINIFDELKFLDAGTLIDMSRNNIYFLPDGYFSNLPDNITRQIWLNSVPGVTPYYIPSNYFEHLPELILDKLAIQNQLTFNRQTYQVPEGYFNNLAENVLGNIKGRNNSVQEELEEISPLLSKISKANVYTVPETYFESLNQVPTQEIQPAKIFSLKSKPRKWIAYAAAACIAALMLGGGYYYMQDNNVNDKNSSVTQGHVTEVKVQQAISQLSDVEIDNYLQNDDDVYTPQNDTQDINIKFLLENMSDEEINNYLIKNSDPRENTKGI